MQGYTKCNNGHFYKESLDRCPYCPSGSASSSGDSEKTVSGGGFASTDAAGSTQSTEVFGKPSGSGAMPFSASQPPSDRTQVFTPGLGTSGNEVPVASASVGSNTPFDRTFIGGVTTTDSSEGSSVAGNSNQPRAARKIVGWIISYTLDPMGIDYRIFEGNNTIGRDPSNSIILAKEPTISGKHVTILFRSGKYYVKDEMSANGSFLNGEDMEIGKPYELKDGDELRLGNAVFKFKSAL
jgi:hypothetical protein